MIRRLLLCAFVSLYTLPVAPGWAQQPTRVPVVGVLVTHAPLSDPVFENLRKGFRELGYENGRNIHIEIVTAEGTSSGCPALRRSWFARTST